jgi:predicted DNA-binding transcriptional regulator AlpA
MSRHEVIDDEITTKNFYPPGAEPHRPSRSRGARSGLWGPLEVAEFLQVSRSWVYQKAERGLLPVIRLPGSSLLRFEPASIEAFARGEWKPPNAPADRPLGRRR